MFSRALMWDSSSCGAKSRAEHGVGGVPMAFPAPGRAPQHRHLILSGNRPPAGPHPTHLPASGPARGPCPLTFNIDASLRNSMRSSLSLLWFSSRTSERQGRGCQGPRGRAEPLRPLGRALTELELQALLQLVYLLRELAQHGAQEGNLLVLLGQRHVHLMEAVVCLLQELLQALEAARLQVRLVCVLVPDERAPGGMGQLSCPPARQVAPSLCLSSPKSLPQTPLLCWATALCTAARPPPVLPPPAIQPPHSSPELLQGSCSPSLASALKSQLLPPLLAPFPSALNSLLLVQLPEALSQVRARLVPLHASVPSSPVAVSPGGSGLLSTCTSICNYTVDGVAPAKAISPVPGTQAALSQGLLKEGP